MIFICMKMNIINLKLNDIQFHKMNLIYNLSETEFQYAENEIKKSERDL